MDEADKAAIAAALQDSWSLLSLLSPFFALRFGFVSYLS